MVKLPCILCMFLLQVDCTLARGQEVPVINAWLEIGSLKFTPTMKERSAGIDAVLKFQMNRILASMQYHDYFDSELAHGGFELFTDANHYHAGNCMIGITNKKCRIGHASLSSGIGVFWGEFEDISVERFATIGWPVEAAASLNIFPFIGINLKLFTNINSKHSLFGFGMDLQLGKLRNFHWFEVVPR